MVLEIRYLTPYPDVIELPGCQYAFYRHGELMHGVDTFFFKNHNCSISLYRYLLYDSGVKLIRKDSYLEVRSLLSLLYLSQLH